MEVEIFDDACFEGDGMKDSFVQPEIIIHDLLNIMNSSHDVLAPDIGAGPPVESCNVMRRVVTVPSAVFCVRDPYDVAPCMVRRAKKRRVRWDVYGCG